MAERVVVIGASIAGLATALALKHSGREVVIVERDDAPPSIEPTAAFTAWDRPGVPQFRLSHSLLARLHKMLRERYPEVIDELAQAGVEPCPVEFVLPSTLIDGYVTRPSDVDLKHLLGRRATLEYVLRRHVERLPNMRFVHGVRVEGLRIAEESAQLRVTGIDMLRGDSHERIEADLVVDAAGGRSKSTEWLRERGAVIEVESQPSEFAYFCRHYHIRDAGPQPFSRRTGAILDYLWFGAFFAEHGHFSLALACPTAEPELLQTIKQPEGFDLIGRSMPGVGDLIGRAEVMSKVLGAGRLTNRWSRHVVKGKPAALGFFAVGDSHVHTNPMYGRGCAAAFVQAHALADVLDASRDPIERAQRYSARVWAELRPQYEFCVSAERLFSGRGQRARGEEIPRAIKVADYFTDQIWAPAVLASPFIARESVKTMQMQEVASFWTRLALIFCMFFLWARRGFRKVERVPERTGPERDELLQVLRTSEPPLAAFRPNERAPQAS